VDGICSLEAWCWLVSIIDWTYLAYDRNDQVWTVGLVHNPHRTNYFFLLVDTATCLTTDERALAAKRLACDNGSHGSHNMTSQLAARFSLHLWPISSHQPSNLGHDQSIQANLFRRILVFKNLANSITPNLLWRTTTSPTATLLVPSAQPFYRRLVPSLLLPSRAALS